MKREDLVKYLWMTEKELKESNIPQYIQDYLRENYSEILFAEYGNDAKDFFYESLGKRNFENDPIQGAIYLQDFFNNLDAEIQEIQNIKSIEKRIFKFKSLSNFFQYTKELSKNEILNIEISKHKPFIDDYIKVINTEIHSLEKGNKKTANKTQKTSYVWQNKPDDELPELYSLMIKEYKLIAPETTYEQFKAVFTGQPIESINPIKWHQDNASELLYFIDKLEQTNNIAHNPKRADYQKLAACFVTPLGNQFNASWKSLKTNLEINLSQDKQKAIDELVNNF